ncbi:MAG: response regulator [Actinomycetota bacterium]|nr:response regulator [Actinomycetota bacterium]
MKRILVVDDEPDIVALIRLKLMREGFEVVEAHNGEAAIKMVASSKPDLIILDIMMPGMNGWEVNERLKANPEYRDIPVIMLTALNEFDEQFKSLWAGVRDYITKPFDFDELVSSVRKVLSEKKIERSGEKTERRNKI